MEWQPIEVAPKDGTEVDLFVKWDCDVNNALAGWRVIDCRYIDGRWFSGVCKFENSSEFYMENAEEVRCFSSDSENKVKKLIITHFMACEIPKS